METNLALMIHGGGHVMFSRKDIRPSQTQLLLDHGLLPVSIDYRLCPEVSLLQGPMVDVCNALRWARHRLPNLKLACPGLKIDGERVVVIGWSSGGHLAMTLGWTARLQNIRPPEAILGFYCPTDYEADCKKFISTSLLRIRVLWRAAILICFPAVWSQPNFPDNTASYRGLEYDLLDAVQDKPVSPSSPPIFLAQTIKLT